jgi:hypothetical protein
MDGYKLTIQQKDSIQGVCYADAQYFNCVQDINGEWFTFLSDADIIIVTDSEWAWILDCPFVEYVPPIYPPINE